MNDRDAVSESRAKRLAPEERSLYESFRSFGMSPVAALSATAGRNGELSSTDPVDTMTEAFQGLGLSEAGARIAAVGRRETEYGLREALSDTDDEASAPRPPGASGDDPAGGQRLLNLIDAGHSIQEAQALIERDPSAGRVTETDDGGSDRRVTLRESQREGTDALTSLVAELEQEGMPFLAALHEAERRLGRAR